MASICDAQVASDNSPSSPSSIIEVAISKECLGEEEGKRVASSGEERRLPICLWKCAGSGLTHVIMRISDRL